MNLFFVPQRKRLVPGNLAVASGLSPRLTCIAVCLFPAEPIAAHVLGTGGGCCCSWLRRNSSKSVWFCESARVCFGRFLTWNSSAPGNFGRCLDPWCPVQTRTASKISSRSSPASLSRMLSLHLRSQRWTHNGLGREPFKMTSTRAVRSNQ